MTDQPLSPAAQAVLDAAVQSVIDACTNAPTYMNWATRYAAAAALEAAADQVVPEHPTRPAWTHVEQVRRELLAIAAELKGSNG